MGYLSRVAKGIGSFHSRHGEQRDLETGIPEHLDGVEQDFQLRTLVGSSHDGVLGSKKRPNSSNPPASPTSPSGYGSAEDGFDTQSLLGLPTSGDYAPDLRDHELEILEAELLNVQMELQSSQCQVEALEQYFESHQRSTEEAAAAARTALDETREEINYYRSRNIVLENEFEKMQEELKYTQVEAARAKGDYEALRQDHQALSQKMTSHQAQKSFLEQEFIRTKSQLEDTQSRFEDVKDRVMVLQGVRRDSLLPTTITENFKDLLDSIDDWVGKWVGNLVEDENLARNAALVLSMRDPTSASALRNEIERNPDVRRTCTVPGTDEDIITSLIWKYLLSTIFDSPFCNLQDATARAATIKALEHKMMRTSAESPAEMYSISTWRCRAINALVNDPEMDEGRQSTIAGLTERLSWSLRIFSQTGGGDPHPMRFLASVRDQIIAPAIALHELMICERDLYRLELNHYTPPSDAPSSATASAAFFHDLEALHCTEIRGPRRVTLKPETLPRDQTGEIQRRLVKLCAVTPALLTQHISDKHLCGDPDVLVKQQVLVLLNPQNWVGERKRTFLFELAFPHPDLVAQAVWN